MGTRWHEAAPMRIPQKNLPPHPLSGALAAALWFEPASAEPEALEAQPAALPESRAQRLGRRGPALILLRHAVLLAPQPLRPYFAVCALEAWRRVPVRELADWSGIPFNLLKRRLAAKGLTPAAVAAWNFALHATWLLDVAELPACLVVSCMRLGRTAALGAVLGARGVPFFGGRVQPGAFSATLDRYLDVLRAAFRA
jgi:hypothetical protein